MRSCPFPFILTFSLFFCLFTRFLAWKSLLLHVVFSQTRPRLWIQKRRSNVPINDVSPTDHDVDLMTIPLSKMSAPSPTPKQTLTMKMPKANRGKRKRTRMQRQDKTLHLRMRWIGWCRWRQCAWLEIQIITTSTLARRRCRCKRRNDPEENEGLPPTSTSSAAHQTALSVPVPLGNFDGGV